MIRSTNSSVSRPAAFIDRDGTLIEEVNFLSRVEDMRLFPYTAEALRRLKQRDFLLIVVTNQSGIARGLFSVEDMNAIHDEIQRQLGGIIDGFYFCPHLPDAGCLCRKPGTGMVDAARADMAIDLSRSWMIGDKRIDVETAENAGLGSAMVMTGYGRSHLAELSAPPDIVAEDILDAVEAILSQPQAEAAR